MKMGKFINFVTGGRFQDHGVLPHPNPSPNGEGLGLPPFGGLPK